MDAVQRIHMWSSPRNVSTAMMYAWRQRADTTVVDEPLYAFYLANTDRDHPGFDEVVASQNTDGPAVIDQVLESSYSTPVVFFKQMAKHLLDLDRSFLTRADNILLTRDPHEMLTSLQQNLVDITIADTGFVELVEILDAILATDRTPIVVDSRHLLAEPATVLGQMCERLGLKFDDAMLQWEAGPKPEDGIWAKYWYDKVHRSTGWAPWKAKPDQLRPGLEAVLEQSQLLYERLRPYSLEP